MYAGPIVDTHFHLFRRADIPQYKLMSAKVVQRDFTPADHRAAMGSAQIIAGVVLQAADVGTGMDELAYIERLPPEPLIGRYISYLPIDRPDAAAIVEQLADHAIVAGVRYSPSQADGDGSFDQRACRRTLRALARHGMVYELSARPWQHDRVYELAAMAPETTFVLGHMGKPRLTAEPQPDWNAGIARLARLPNVVCKLSVPLVEPDDRPYPAETMGTLVRHIVEQFGYDRVLYGSNFPVNFIAVTCVQWLDMLEAFLGDAGEDDLDKLYRRNAVRTYRLPQPVMEVLPD
ncbi:MAG: amidohydrolase [Lautropia sp.]